ncbi:MAG: hypothetical protein LBL52_02175 [Rickettsiales bacterium]|jgi:hypothetical protein|nr:hypothetical protein [Rickettsiales bacterium]
MKQLHLVLITLFVGCVGANKDITDGNFRRKAQVKQTANKFYMPANLEDWALCQRQLDRGVSISNGCGFEQSKESIIRGYELSGQAIGWTEQDKEQNAELEMKKKHFVSLSDLAIGRPLDVRQYKINLTDNNFSYDKKKDWAMMVAAEVALQEGYSFFTITDRTELNGCSSNYEARTHGNVYKIGDNSYYSGRTKLVDTGICIFSENLNILAYNNKDVLRYGVLTDKGIYGRLYLNDLEAVPTNAKGNYTTVFDWPVQNAWRTSYSVMDVINGEKSKYPPLGLFQYNISIEKPLTPTLEKTYMQRD